MRLENKYEQLLNVDDGSEEENDHRLPKQSNDLHQPKDSLGPYRKVNKFKLSMVWSEPYK